MAEFDHRAHERGLAGIASKTADQALVDLDRVDRQLLEVLDESDDEPVPKSSIAIFTPSALSAVPGPRRTDTSGFRDAARSVTSRHSARRVFTPAALSCPANSVTKLMSSSWRADTFTVTVRSCRCSRQIASWRSEWASTY